MLHTSKMASSRSRQWNEIVSKLMFCGKGSSDESYSGVARRHDTRYGKGKNIFTTSVDFKAKKAGIIV